MAFIGDRPDHTHRFDRFRSSLSEICTESTMACGVTFLQQVRLTTIILHPLLNSAFSALPFEPVSLVFSVSGWKWYANLSVASYPLLLVQALYHLSTNDTRGLYHLKWRTRDSAEGVLMRATEYILINLIITQLAR